MENNPIPSGKIGIGDKSDSIIHRGPREEIIINRFHLILVLERLKKGSKLPSYRDVWPWIGTFVAFLLTLVTAECKDFLSFKATSWQAIFFIATVLSFGMIVYTLIQAFAYRKERSKKPEEEVDEIIEKMAKDREKLAKSGQ